MSTPNPEESAVIAFNWKVSSENNTGGLDDVLVFIIDGVDQDTIEGEIDWRTESFVLSLGVHTLRWEYRKDNLDSAGADAGWVDRVVITSPDLIVGDLELLTVEPIGGFVGGDEIEVVMTISNPGLGDVPATPPFSVQVRISPDLLFDEEGALTQNDFILGAFLINDGLPSLNSLLASQRLNLPPDLNQAGSFFLAARVDALDDVVETDDGNNTFFNPNPIQVLPNLPEVTITVSNFDPALGAVLNPGDVFSFDLTITNSGVADIPEGNDGAFAVRVLLSLDEFFDTIGDFDLVENLVIDSGLAGGAETTITQSVTIPIFAPMGSFFLFAEVDTDNVLNEPNEEDNLFRTDDPNVTIGGISLEEALDNDVLAFSTGGDGTWFGQTGESISGGDAAQSPPLAAGSEAFFETTVAGPAEVTFFWKANTERIENFLKFTIDGAEPKENGRILGTTGEFVEVSHVAPAEINLLRWTYVQGGAGEGEETSWVDGISTEDLAGPDLIVENVEFNAGILVPTLDDLEVTVLARNQGEAVDLPDDFKVTATLSLDQVLGNEDDVFIGDLVRFQDLDPDDRFGYAAVRPLPTMVQQDIDNDGVLDDIIIPGGNYFLIVELDSSNLVAEFDEGNNRFVSPDNNVIVQPRPDLVPVFLNFDPLFPDQTDAEPGVFLFGESLDLSFSIRNDGLAATLAQPLTINIVLSDDREFGGGDFVLLSVTESTGLPVGQSRTFKFTREILDTTPTGEFFYLGLVIDAGNVASESNEDNNALGSDDRDLFFAEVSLAEAIDDTTGRLLRNDETFPFFGQTQDSFDGQDAARSAKIDDGEQAGFEFSVRTPVDENNNDLPGVITFAWKVSSERDVITNVDLTETFKGDTLSFFIDGLLRKAISGEIDWTVESFAIPAGEHVVRWEYEKDLLVTSGEDAGWVDRVITISPDLTVTDIEILTAEPAGGFTSGAAFDLSVTFKNIGLAEVRTTPPFAIQLLISEDRQLEDAGDPEANDFVIDTFFSSDGVQVNEELTIFRSVNVPFNIAQAAEYFIAAVVDVFDDVPEANESNNDLVTEEDETMNIQPNIDLDEALDFVAERGWETRGNSTWFGQNTIFAAVGGNDDAAQASPIGVEQSASLETEIVGPGTVEFYWSVSSVENFNSLTFTISGSEISRISGEQDFAQVTEFVPAGVQTLSWTYDKTVANDDALFADTAWVDLVSFVTTDEPDLAVAFFDEQFTAGSYVLDKETGEDSKRMRITVEVENMGGDPAVLSGFTTSDVAVHLSTDLVWGNSDDVTLGSFGSVTLNSAGRLIFGGPIVLPRDAPAGNYFVAVYIDFFNKVIEFGEDDPDFVKFSKDDNNLFITASRIVTVRRLPDLIIENPIMDAGKILYPEGTLSFNYTVRNRGLAATRGDQVFNQRITIFAVDPQLFPSDPGNATNDPFLIPDLTGGQAIEIKTLVPFLPENAVLPGVSPLNPSGGAIDFEAVLTLPTLVEIQTAFGITFIEGRVYYLLIEVDTENAIEESGEDNAFIPLTAFRLLFLPLDAETFDDWAFRYSALTSYVATDPDPEISDADGDNLSDFEEFALDTNPVSSITQDDSALLDEFGITRIGTEDFHSITFDLNKFGSDIRYRIEVATVEDPDGDGIVDEPADGDFAPIAEIEPPFLDDTGPESLTGEGGLKDHPLVHSVISRGYTARVTVRDTIPISDLEGSDPPLIRFMRLRIERIGP